MTININTFILYANDCFPFNNSSKLDSNVVTDTCIFFSTLSFDPYFDFNTASTENLIILFFRHNNIRLSIKRYCCLGVLEI